MTMESRAIAHKITVGQILQSAYEQEENEPNGIVVENKKILRVNLLASIAAKEHLGTVTTFLLDDGTGQIIMRLFEENAWSQLAVGEIILIVGKVRRYNQEKYISPEIIKKNMSGWLKVRRKELSYDLAASKPSHEPKSKDTFSIDKVLSIIRDLDKGAGASIEEILEHSAFAETEKVIEEMLVEGVIFQNSPGKVKIL